MGLIQWNDSYSVGVGKFDSQHRELLDILNELHQAMAVGERAEVAAAVVQRLEDYAITHLEFEEQLLEREGYPGFAQHKAQHDAYVEKMRCLSERVASGQLAVSAELIAFLQDWWTNHIGKVDKQYAAFLRAKGVA